MSDIVDSLKTAVVERVTSPILGPFVLSWMACNWRVWVYAAESTPAAQKIASIACVLGSFWGVTGPLLLTAFIVLGVPYVQAFASRIVAGAKSLQLKHEAAFRAATRDDEKVELQLLRSALDQRRSENSRRDYELKTLEVDLQNRARDLSKAEEAMRRREEAVAQHDLRAQALDQQAREFDETRAEVRRFVARSQTELDAFTNTLRTVEQLARKNPASALAQLQLPTLAGRVRGLRAAAASLAEHID